MLHTTLTISPSIATAGRHHRVCVATSRRPHPHLLESGLPRSPSLAHHPWCQRHGPSLRWIRAKRKLNESLAEAAIGHVGKLLREEAAKLGIPTVSVPPHGTSQTCPRCGDRHPNNRKSQAVFRCRNCGLYAHADWTAAVIIRNRAYVRHCEWQHGYTPDVLTAPTGWREQPSGSETQQPRLGLDLSVFKPEGTATIRPGGRVRGPRPDRRIQSGGPRRPNDGKSAHSPRFRGRAQFVHKL